MPASSAADAAIAADVAAAARRVADEVLFPAAQQVDRAQRLPAGHLDALADAGLFGLVGPATHGGLDVAPGLARRVLADVGSGCGATFFVWVQHHGVVRTLRSSSNTALVDSLLAGLCAGRRLAGTAFAHIRRPGPPAIAATRVDGGWRLDGAAPWATSWGIADVFSVAAVTTDGDLVWSVIEGHDTAGVRATPLALPLFGATATVALSFDGCLLPDDRVAAVEPVETWRAGDRRSAALGQPAVFGVADRARRLLAGQPGRDAADAAVRLGHHLDRAWSDDEALLDATIGGADVVDDASDHRAACLHLARRSTTALLAAVGGRGMDLDHPAQRLAREADFYVIQAQTTDGRAATLRSI